MSRKPPPPAAVLVIDVLNDLAFPGGEEVVPWAHKMAARLKPFLVRARAAGFPVVYVNDNYDHWRSDHGEIYRYCTRAGSRGRAVVRKLKPRRDDYFIVKPKHSGFFGTSLQPLLQHLGARRLILTGMATNLCVFFTAHDAHMHEYSLYALSDCCAAESDFDHDTALEQLKRFCGVTVMRSDEVDFEAERPAVPEKKDRTRKETAGKSAEKKRAASAIPRKR